MFRRIRPYSTIRQLTREYGTLAIGVYGTLSTTTFGICLYSVSKFNITQQDITNVWIRIGNTIGYDIKQSESTEEGWISKGWKKLPESFQTEENQTRIRNVLIAMAMTKLFSPFKLALVAMVVPPLGKRLVQRGWMQQGRK